MSLKGFVCPDGIEIDYEDCFVECRLDRRCLTLPTLALCMGNREVSTTLSTTQCLNGTAYEYLKHKHDYYINPKDRAFSLLGTIHHENLSKKAEELGITTEVSLTGNDRNLIDLVEIENGEVILTDYKTWGSYRVAKFLGIQKLPNGFEYYTDKRSGKPKRKELHRFEECPEYADTRDIELQLNRYRVLLQQFDVHVDRMQVQVTVRDGGLIVASNRGIAELMYLRDVNHLGDAAVNEFFDNKQQKFDEMLNTGTVVPCSDEECWGGTKCERYCEVAKFCKGGTNG